MAQHKGAPRPPGSGRAKGTTNKTTKVMREMVLEAFHGVGGIDYLKRQAEAEPRAFMTLVAKMIPNEVKAEFTGSTVVEIMDLSDGGKNVGGKTGESS